MRIIAGKHKRRQLVTVPGTDVTRPTSDRVRESLFNIIASETPGAIVMDLFAGSGALGVEALSRGAKHVAFVEKNPTALSCIRKNLTTLGENGTNIRIVAADVVAFLKNPSATFADPDGRDVFAASTDIIFADPPYDSAWYDEALSLLESSGLCHAETLAVIEMAHDRELAANDTVPWEREGERTYGKTRLEFWRRRVRVP
ncbi:MAG: 16S rRNA (guanine(966)-N(2))-methyltransferase RsmD [Silvanigrellales bacterium]|nr:16S rRNA (guanine(966)-N(2))-methyltransferase RsmD [Silvanigrellales bacterium]